MRSSMTTARAGDEQHAMPPCPWGQQLQRRVSTQPPATHLSATHPSLQLLCAAAHSPPTPHATHHTPTCALRTHWHAVAELHHLADLEAVGRLGAGNLGHHLIPPLACSEKHAVPAAVSGCTESQPDAALLRTTLARCAAGCTSCVCDALNHSPKAQRPIQQGTSGPTRHILRAHQPLARLPKVSVFSQPPTNTRCCQPTVTQLQLTISVVGPHQPLARLAHLETAHRLVEARHQVLCGIGSRCAWFRQPCSQRCRIVVVV